eukprot:TRINITY_DN2077_c0_g1_i6.p2 TRINITY_DN2077_c0_g1~~TRINITY_DN2077_c0_g1_i6.p2  ORF type:complete len:144 (+),score=29.60 TRINITY_DN2077_c0_g1_i6:31-462(+)
MGAKDRVMTAWGNLDKKEKLVLGSLMISVLVSFILVIGLFAGGSTPSVRCNIGACCTEYCPSDASGLCAEFGCKECVVYGRGNNGNTAGHTCMGYTPLSVGILGAGGVFFVIMIVCIVVIVVLIKKWDVFLGSDLAPKEQAAS